jgi:hypothetical protein
MMRMAMKLLGRKEGSKAVLAIQDADQAGDGDSGNGEQQ